MNGKWLIDIQSSFVLDNTITVAFKHNCKTFFAIIPNKGDNLYELIGSLESIKHQILKCMEDNK